MKKEHEPQTLGERLSPKLSYLQIKGGKKTLNCTHLTRATMDAYYLYTPTHFNQLSYFFARFFSNCWPKL